MKHLLATTAILAALSVSATAGTFHADSFSQPTGFQNVTIGSPVSETVRAGEIVLHDNTGPVDLAVWCLDVMDLLVTPYTFQVTTLGIGDNHPGLPAGGFTAAQIRQIASLMIGGLTLGGLDAADDDAATQLAIWRVEYGGAYSDNASGALLTRVNLELTDSSAGGILDCALCTLNVLTDAVQAPNQALGFAVVPSPTPLPASAFLFGIGLVGLAGLVRRRRSNRLA